MHKFKLSLDYYPTGVHNELLRMDSVDDFDYTWNIVDYPHYGVVHTFNITCTKEAELFLKLKYNRN